MSDDLATPPFFQVVGEPPALADAATKGCRRSGYRRQRGLVRGSGDPAQVYITSEGLSSGVEVVEWSIDYLMQPDFELLLWTLQWRIPHWWLEAVNPAQEYVEGSYTESPDKQKRCNIASTPNLYPPPKKTPERHKGQLNPFTYVGQNV